MGIERFADMINECNNIVFFGGAGVSTESGVKDYRSKDGLYNTINDYGVPPETILSIDFFESDPEIFYDFYRKYFISNVLPNKAHKALAELESMGKLKAVITQNIDGLHQKAGSQSVVELHGTTKSFYCHSCKRTLELENVMNQIKSEKVPCCEHCGGLAKPRVVLYGEMLYDGVAESAIEYVSSADMLIVGGTSLAVYPAASFVRYFRGKYVIIINKDATDFDKNADLVFREPIGEVMDKVMESLVRNKMVNAK